MELSRETQLPHSFWNITSEYEIHIIHHYIAWIFLLFTVMHVYLAFREDVMEESGEVSSMVSGMKFYPEDPEDIEDLYGKRK